MVPRPRPHQSYPHHDSPSLEVFQASPNDKPSLYDARLHGRGRLTRNLFLSGWNPNVVEVDHDEEVDALVQDSIELTTYYYSDNDSHHPHPHLVQDPLISASTSSVKRMRHSSDVLVCHNEDVDMACLNDAEIAASMAEEWNEQGGTGTIERIMLPPPRVKEPEKPGTLRQTIICTMTALVMATLVMSLSIYAVFVFGTAHSSKTSRYTCPASLHDLIEQGKNDTQALCPEDTGSSFQPFTVPDLDARLEPRKRLDSAEWVDASTTSMLQPLDVVFLGRLFNDTNDPSSSSSSSWLDQDGSGIQGIEIGSLGEQPWTILHQINQELLIPLSPKVWWISLGGGHVQGSSFDDDTANECVQLKAQTGIALLVQRIMKEQPQAHIVLSPPPLGDDDDDDAEVSMENLFHERLQCLAAVAGDSHDDHVGSVQYYNPFLVHSKDQEDDDFFASRVTPTPKIAATVEEAQQAVVIKLQELLR